MIKETTNKCRGAAGLRPKMVNKKPEAFSIIEVIVALGIFGVVVAGGVLGLIPAMQMGKKGGDYFFKKQQVEEGVEAIMSIRNQGWSNLTEGSFDVGVSGGKWNLTTSGSRQIGISQIDNDRYLVTSKFEGISQSMLLTNWQKSIGVNYEGLVVYGDGTTLPKFRTYSNGTTAFGSENNVIASINGYGFSLKTSPIKTEAIMGMVSNSGVLSIFCFDGTNWTLDWTATVGGTATTRRFDIVYETNSGDVIVAYGNNGSGTNEINYRTKLGSSNCGSGNWTGANNFDPQRTSGIVYWVKMNNDKRSNSNLATIVWADSNNDLSVAMWDGNNFVNEPASATETSLEVVSTAADVEDFDVEFETSSGNLMLVWANSAGANGTNGVRYRRCIGGTATCTWGAVTTPPTFSDDAHNLDLAANPTSNEMVLASIGYAGSDLQAGYWSGTAWTNRANLDTSAARPVAGGKNIAVGWLNSGGVSRSVIVYDDGGGNSIDWYVGSGGSFTAQTDVSVSPNLATNNRWTEIYVDPKNQNQLMVVIADSANDLFAKRLVMTSTPTFNWSNTENGTALETNLPSAISNPFGFGYWIK